MSTIARSALCWCGSGRPERSCHELPRRERRRRKSELDVLGEATDLAALFPAVRPRDCVFAVYAESAASQVKLEREGAWVPTHIVEDGLALLDEQERDRIVRSWYDLYPDRWGSLVADGGDETLIRRSVVAGAVRAAILDRMPLQRDSVSLYESGLFADLPANALTLLVPPPSIWARDQALLANGIFPGGPRFEPTRFDALEQYAGGCVGDAERARLREAADRIERQLPVEALPRASATLVAGCEVIATDDGWCSAIAARQLALYACSPQVIEEARAAAGRR